jgi:cytochrome c553
MGELERFRSQTLVAACIVMLVCTVRGAADVSTGATIFKAECASCHGRRATGGLGPDLTRGTFRNAVDDDGLFRVIAGGIPGSRMPGALGRHSAEDIWQLVGYVRSLGPATGATVRSDKPTDRQPSGEQLRAEPQSAAGIRGAGDANLIVRITTLSGAVHSGRRMDEDTFSVRVLDDRGVLRSFERSALRSIERLASRTDSAPTELDEIVQRLGIPTK